MSAVTRVGVGADVKVGDAAVSCFVELLCCGLPRCAIVLEMR